jgi:tetrahydromethanopterin S-methyltransferase subunit B
MPESDSGGTAVDTDTRTDTFDGNSSVGSPTDSAGVRVDQLYTEARGDTSELPSRVQSLEMTQTALQDYVTELNRRHQSVERRVTDVEREDDVVRSLTERVTHLEDQMASMEQAGQNAEIDLNGSYPAFAAFSLRATVAALLFIVLFATFYTEGVIGGVLFGALLAFLAVVSVASATTWYKLK